MHISNIFSTSACCRGLKPGKVPPPTAFLAITAKWVLSMPTSGKVRFSCKVLKKKSLNLHRHRRP